MEPFITFAGARELRPLGEVDAVDMVRHPELLRAGSKPYAHSAWSKYRGQSSDLPVLFGSEALQSRALPLPLQRKPFQQIIQLQLPRPPPIEDRLHDTRREQRQPQHPADVGRGTPFARARSSSVACTPASSIFRHRNARASALTMALSTRGHGGPRPDRAPGAAIYVPFSAQETRTNRSCVLP